MLFKKHGCRTTLIITFYEEGPTDVGEPLLAYTACIHAECSLIYHRNVCGDMVMGIWDWESHITVTCIVTILEIGTRQHHGFRVKGVLGLIHR